MSELRIRLFGGLELTRGGTPLPPLPTRRARSLLAYLVVNRDRPVPRDVLCGLLWGDQPEAEARKALRSALWRIRSVLETRDEDRGLYLRAVGPHVTFPGRGQVWTDVAEFEACLGDPSHPAPGGAMAGPPRPAGTAGSGVNDRRAGELTRAVGLYQGDLLDGIYDDWCYLDRERFSQAFLTALEHLAAYHEARGHWLEAITFGRELLRKDPIREHIHRRLMVCHMGLGDRPSALRQFETCVRLTRDELGIEPMEETRRLHRWIRDHGTLPPEMKGPEMKGPEMRGSDARELDAREPEARRGSGPGRSEASRPEAAGPEPTGPETRGARPVGPEAAGPEPTGPEAAGPETGGARPERPGVSGPDSAADLQRQVDDALHDLQRLVARLERARMRLDAGLGDGDGDPARGPRPSRRADAACDAPETILRRT